MPFRHGRLQQTVQRHGDRGVDVGNQNVSGGQDIFDLGIPAKYARRGRIHEQGK